MQSEWPPGPLPLLDALMAYGDREALRQRRRVERHATDDQLARYADFVVTAASERQASDVHHADPSAQAVLARSREALVDSFREAIRDERIFLRGIPAGMPARSAPELIPNGWAMELELRFSDASVRRLADRWTSVVVTTMSPRADELATSRRLVEASETARVGYMSEGAFTLRSALLRLSDTSLAEALLAIEAELAHFRRTTSGHPLPGSDGVLTSRDPASRDLAEHKLFDRERRTRAALMGDFVDRLRDGRIILTGLQIQPQLAASRTRLSPDWVPHMVFDWERQAVRVFDAVFIDVQGQPKPPATQRSLKAPGRVSGGRPRGRPRFPFDEFVAIIAARSWKRRQTNKAEANALLRQFSSRYPDRLPPSHRTVLSHVPKLYEEVVRRSAAQKSRKSA